VLDAAMTNTDFVSAYENHVANLQKRLSRAEALRQAVGGDFVAVGKLEYHLLRSLGLADGHLVIDVGCGSGRLACQLAAFQGIRYLGTDVVDELLRYAAELCVRPDFRFERTDGTRIPTRDAEADFVCFFSVFTHLLHEDTFKYFREAARVLKTGGRLVMSFLEFKVPLHWAIFIGSVDHAKPGEHLNQFIDRDAIKAWADHSGFVVESIRGGDTAHIPIPEEIVFDNGARYGSFGTFGQSVAVLVRK
jgi:SAM-dependent methyltransferase